MPIQFATCQPNGEQSLVVGKNVMQVNIPAPPPHLLNGSWLHVILVMNVTLVSWSTSDVFHGQKCISQQTMNIFFQKKPLSSKRHSNTQSPYWGKPVKKKTSGENDKEENMHNGWVVGATRHSAPCEMLMGLGCVQPFGSCNTSQIKTSGPQSNVSKNYLFPSITFFYSCSLSFCMLPRLYCFSLVHYLWFWGSLVHLGKVYFLEKFSISKSKMNIKNDAFLTSCGWRKQSKNDFPQEPPSSMDPAHPFGLGLRGAYEWVFIFIFKWF